MLRLVTEAGGVESGVYRYAAGRRLLVPPTGPGAVRTVAARLAMREAGPMTANIPASAVRRMVHS
jgi:hypothetical protein